MNSQLIWAQGSWLGWLISVLVQNILSWISHPQPSVKQLHSSVASTGVSVQSSEVWRRSRDVNGRVMGDIWTQPHSFMTSHRCVCYLWDADAATRLQEVLYVPPALGHGEFRLWAEVTVSGGVAVSGGTDRPVTHHGGGGDVDAWDRPRPHVICQVTQHHAIRQSCSQVTRQRHFETSLDILQRHTVCQSPVKTHPNLR